MRKVVLGALIGLMCLLSVLFAPALNVEAKSVNEYSYSDLIKSASWITRSGKVSLSVTMSAQFESISNGNLKGALATRAFNLLKAKFSSSKNWENTDGMRNQFMCHYLFAFKTPWNLEPWRKTVSMSATTAALCNP
ncbi:DUF2599 domain-containing protein [Lacticaseibacillus suibinensis]|uniref:DUF2599 domain-containing protein n=2 Tax=Lacticaseibacillus TaxID=2759736 RepID=UPI000F7948E5|nr:DUF2599 domain-containing protein [Lacticaseibacillus suibinensis]